jgi:hypothetical protein
MASSNKKSSTSHDISTDTDDSDCAKYGSDSNTNDISSSTKHRGYEEEEKKNDIEFYYSYRTKRINNKMKPCLVHKTSTSDEELQSNETNQIISSSIHTGRSNEQPTHGILKVPSGKIYFFV